MLLWGIAVGGQPVPEGLDVVFDFGVCINVHLSVEVPVEGFSKLRFLLCRHDHAGWVTNIWQLDMGHLGLYRHGSNG